MSLPALPYSSEVEFFGSHQPAHSPNSVRVTQQEFAHDVAVLTFWADDVEADSYASGMPMALTFGRAMTKRTFYGYVSHANRTNTSLPGVGLMGRNSTTVVCVGASWLMKESGTETFRNQTASQVVQQIATRFGFAANIVSDTTVWPTLHMAGMSYWEFCVMLAKRIGYTFFCSGVKLVFKPRQTDPMNINGLVAFYDYRNNPAVLPVFSPTMGVTQPGGGQLTNRNLAGINPRTSQVIFASVAGNPEPTTLGLYPDAPVFDQTEHLTVRSQDDANIKISGAGRTNQLYLTATAHAAGDPLIAQGSLVFVSNANGSQNGLWLVTKAEQLMMAKEYTMDLSLGRDSLGATPNISGVLPTEMAPRVTLSQQMWAAA